MTAVYPTASYATKQERTWKVFIFECLPQSINTTAPPSCFLRTGAQSDKWKCAHLHGQEVYTGSAVFRGAGSQQGCGGNTRLVFNAPERAPSQHSSSTGQGPGATAAPQTSLCASASSWGAGSSQLKNGSLIYHSPGPT